MVIEELIKQHTPIPMKASEEAVFAKVLKAHAIDAGKLVCRTDARGSRHRDKRGDVSNRTMKYIIDSEFIDTPTCSALISLAVVREDGAHLYFEFDYPEHEITPWLAQNVVPHLVGQRTTTNLASRIIDDFIGADRPEFWCYYGAYDWYFFCRLWGGFMSMPQGTWPMLFREFAMIQQGVPDVAGAEHNALNDCRSILRAMQLRGMVS